MAPFTMQGVMGSQLDAGEVDSGASDSSEFAG